MDKKTTIWLSESTKKRLDAIGEFNDTYDSILNRILDDVCKRKR